MLKLIAFCYCIFFSLDFLLFRLVKANDSYKDVVSLAIETKLPFLHRYIRTYVTLVSIVNCYIILIWRLSMQYCTYITHTILTVYMYVHTVLGQAAAI